MSRRMLGEVSKAILPPKWLLITLVIMVGMKIVVPGANILPFPFNLLGLPFIVSGVVLNLAADRSFKNQDTTIKPFMASNALITGGVFTVSRHPMYLGFVQILTGTAMLLGSLTPFIVIFAFVILMEKIYIAIEERMLEERFGEAWLRYEARVRKWI